MISLRSKETAVLLTHLFLHENDKLFVNEMARMFGVDKRNLVKKLRFFAEEGLLSSEKKGQEVYYSLNKSFPLYQEYKKIVLKTYGIEKQLSQALRAVKGVEEAYLYGSYARNKMKVHSDIDLLVVGNANTMDLHKSISAVQEKISREINLINMSAEEFRRKEKENDPFLTEFINGGKIKLL
ncbi:MAG: nucleotidyltransferase domain-containing protein [Elusimicrobiota bacterium]